MNLSSKLSSYLPRIRIVEWVYPYNTWSDSRTSGLFNKIVQHRFDTFRPVYPKGILPVDSFDFIATHHLICLENDEGLEILCGYKTVSLSRCHFHAQPFPAFSFFEGSQCEPHVARLHEIIEHHKDTPECLVYDGSFAPVPAIRSNPELFAFVLELIRAEVVWHSNEYGIKERIGCAVLVVRADKYFRTIGYEPFAVGGKLLHRFPNPRLLGRDVIMMSLRQFTDSADQAAKHYIKFWNNRICIA